MSCHRAEGTEKSVEEEVESLVRVFFFEAGEGGPHNSRFERRNMAVGKDEK